MDEAELYTLRVWRHTGRWRAVVRAVGEEQGTLFTEAAPLAEWLLRPAAARAPGARQKPSDAGADGRAPQKRSKKALISAAAKPGGQ